MAAYNSLTHRLRNVPMTEENFQETLKTIKYIAAQNSCNILIVDKLVRKQNRNYKIKESSQHKKKR